MMGGTLILRIGGYELIKVSDLAAVIDRDKHYSKGKKIGAA